MSDPVTPKEILAAFAQRAKAAAEALGFNLYAARVENNNLLDIFEMAAKDAVNVIMLRCAEEIFVAENYKYAIRHGFATVDGVFVDWKSAEEMMNASIDKYKLERSNGNYDLSCLARALLFINTMPTMDECIKISEEKILKRNEYVIEKLKNEMAIFHNPADINDFIWLTVMLAIKNFRDESYGPF